MTEQLKEGMPYSKMLREIERVLKPGGHAIHILMSDKENENPLMRS